DSTILNPCARPDTTTTYALVVTDLSTGCTSELTTTDTLATITVHVNPIPIAEAGPDKDICEGESVILEGFGHHAGPDYQYQWTPAADLSSPTVPNPIATPPLTTTYTLVVWSNNCPSYADNMIVNVHTNPTVDAGPDVETCQGVPVMLDGSASGDSTATNYEFAWTPSMFLDDPMLEDPMALPDTTTWFYASATSNFGCESPMDSALVTILSTPIANAGAPQAICLGNDAQLEGTWSFNNTPSTSHNGLNYAWSPNVNISDSTIQFPTANPTESMWYYFTVWTAECSTTDSVFITVIPEIGVSVTADTTLTCAGDSVTLTATAGIGGADFTWTPSSGLSNVTGPVTMAAPDVSTTYSVIATEGGCADTADIDIQVLPTPIPNYVSSLESGCAPHTVSFTQTATDGIFYIWDFGDGSPVSNEENPIHTYDNPGNYNVSLTTMAPGGCAATINSLDIKVSEPIAADFSSNPDFPAELSLPNTSVQFFSEARDAVAHTWEFGDGQNSTELNPVHVYQQEGSFMVTLTVSNEDGCVSKVTNGPYVIMTPELFIPNVFSPNDDNINDRFLVEYSGSQPFNIQIFDRWGVQMYESNNKVKGWDGRDADGMEVPDGVYYYRVKVGDRDFAGSLSLVR
ncbi:MAG: PKD domain-containing protein, partial [Bacteroidota bacterium]